jgi:hypothetical protein
MRVVLNAQVAGKLKLDFPVDAVAVLRGRAKRPQQDRFGNCRAPVSICENAIRSLYFRPWMGFLNKAHCLLHSALHYGGRANRSLVSVI